MDESVGSHCQQRPRRLAVEPLEARTLLSIAIGGSSLPANLVWSPALVGLSAVGQPILHEVEAGARSGPALATLAAAPRDRPGSCGR